MGQLRWGGVAPRKKREYLTEKRSYVRCGHEITEVCSAVHKIWVKSRYRLPQVLFFASVCYSARRSYYLHASIIIVGTDKIHVHGLQRIILRLADALIVMDSRLVIRVENMVTTSSLEVLGVDLNGAMSNSLRLALLILLSLLPVA